MPYQTFSSTLLKIKTFGSMKTLVSSPPNQPTDLFSFVPSNLNHGKGFGKPMLPTNARSLFGLLSVTVVGQQIAYKKGDCHILTAAHCVTRKTRQYNTSLPLACLPDSSGSTSSSP